MENPFLTTRRDFLKTTLLGGALSWTVPSFVLQTFQTLHAQALDSSVQVATGKDAPILVVLQLAGGNDGLNTIIPTGNDFYYKSRPTLGIPGDTLLKLDDHTALNPNLTAFKSLFDDGNLSVVQGVGYPNPNRSHFRSTEIWQTASDSERFEKYGWLGRYFDNYCQGCDPTVAVSIGRQMPQSFSAHTPTGISVDNPQNYRFIGTDKSGKGQPDATEYFYRELNGMDVASENPTREENAGGSIGAVPGMAQTGGSSIDFLERTALDAKVSSDKILEISRKVTNAAPYPGSQLGNSLKLIARLIGGGMSTRVFYASQGGYDTHVNQKNAHDRLLKDLGDSVKAFCDDLKAQGNFQRVMIMTFSEFGRRVAENANGGTDHGAAAPLFIVGGKIKGGLLGKYPSLNPADLNDGDLKYTTDFRTVYAGVLEGWLKVSSSQVLGKQFEPLPLV